MYDDHKLKRSEMYFTVLQLLRIFEDWASDLVEDVEALIPPVREKMRQRLVAHESEAEAHAIIEDNWKLLIAHAQDSKTDVVGQIERRKQEVSSLRDGVSIIKSLFMECLHACGVLTTKLTVESSFTIRCKSGRPQGAPR